MNPDKSMPKKYKDDALYTVDWNHEWIDLDEYIRRIVRDEFKKLSQDSNVNT